MLNRCFTIVAAWAAAMTAVLSFTGCGGVKTPEGMPTLIPATVVLTQADKPLADAELTLHSTSTPPSSWAVSGKTDASGKAVLMTSGQYKGAPAGPYTLCVRKAEVEIKPDLKDEDGNPMEFTPEQTSNPQSMDMRYLNYFDTVDPQYWTPDSSTLTMEISDANKEFKFDLGEAIREQR